MHSKEDTARTGGPTGTATRARLATTRGMGTAGTPGPTGPALRERGMRRADAPPARYLDRASTRLKGRSAMRVVQQVRIYLLYDECTSSRPWVCWRGGSPLSLPAHSICRCTRRHGAGDVIMCGSADSSRQRT